jgi:hypothetical protein
MGGYSARPDKYRAPPPNDGPSASRFVWRDADTKNKDWLTFDDEKGASTEDTRLSEAQITYIKARIADGREVTHHRAVAQGLPPHRHPDPAR